MPAKTPNVFTYPRNEPGTQGHLDLVEPLRDAAADSSRTRSRASPTPRPRCRDARRTSGASRSSSGTCATRRRSTTSGST